MSDSPVKKIDYVAVKEEPKKDDATDTETEHSSEIEQKVTGQKEESPPIKTETSEATIPKAAEETVTPVSDEKDESAECKDEKEASALLSADDVAKEIGAAMVSLATEKDKKPVDEAPKEAVKKEPNDDMETEENDLDAQAKLANESSDEESSSVEEGEKSTGTSWNNSYSNELKKMYSDVDADTRAVAEEMIRAATAHKEKPTEEAESPKVDEKEGEANTDKDSNKNDDSKKDKSKGEEEPTKKPLIAKGQEPSALELALKQQGITQSDQLRSTQFPFRLHNMLDDAERSGHAHIVSWCPGGDSFKIHKPAKLIQVLQKYFRQSKFKSFLRQLQGYNFKRITRGKDQGVVSHPLFLRGRRSVSTLMRRKRVGPKPEAEERASKLAIAARKVLDKPKPRNSILAQQPPTSAQRPIVHPTPSSIHSAAAAGFLKKAAAVAPASAVLNNPHPQDVLCVDYPNGHQVKNFQGNRKLVSIVQKITGHYMSANESVRTMIVNEISSRIQNSGSRFLKLSKDGLSWVECSREEMFRKVITCFEQEILSKEKGQIDLTGEADAPVPSALPIDKLTGFNGISAAPSSLTDPLRRPRNQDVVLRGGPGSEKEGNTYLKTMIQANVGQQQDSFEMKRIKCRAILERMKRRGSRFFLKLKDTDSDNEMYILSDAEAQDVIYTAFCAEEKKVQSILADPPTSAASTMMRAKALAGLDTSHTGISGLPGLGGGASLGAGAGLVGAGARLGAGVGLGASSGLIGVSSAYGASRAAALQSDAALLSQLKAKNEMSLLASHNALKRPLPGQHHTHESLIEKRLRAETDEHIKLLIERERQRQDPYAAAAGLASRLPFGRSPGLESSLPLSAAALGGHHAAAASATSRLDALVRERQADELLLKQAEAARAARAPFAGVAAPGLVSDHPKSNNHFVEFLKKKYVKSAQEQAW